jgi:hypothetical protein
MFVEKNRMSNDYRFYALTRKCSELKKIICALGTVLGLTLMVSGSYAGPGGGSSLPDFWDGGLVLDPGGDLVLDPGNSLIIPGGGGIETDPSGSNVPAPGNISLDPGDFIYTPDPGEIAIDVESPPPTGQYAPMPFTSNVDMSGVFNVSIPFELPAGISGTAPILSYDYSSQNQYRPTFRHPDNQNFKSLIYNWALSGIPTIENCRRVTKLFSGNQSAKCLFNGHSEVALKPVENQTNMYILDDLERDPTQSVTVEYFPETKTYEMKNSETKFRVTFGLGLKASTLTPSVKAIVVDGSGPVFHKAHSMTDRFGNEISIEWEGLKGWQLPTVIKYACTEIRMTWKTLSRNQTIKSRYFTGMKISNTCNPAQDGGVASNGNNYFYRLDAHKIDGANDKVVYSTLMAVKKSIISNETDIDAAISLGVESELSLETYTAHEYSNNDSGGGALKAVSHVFGGGILKRAVRYKVGYEIKANRYLWTGDVGEENQTIYELSNKIAHPTHHGEHIYKRRVARTIDWSPGDGLKNGMGDLVSEIELMDSDVGDPAMFGLVRSTKTYLGIANSNVDNKTLSSSTFEYLGVSAEDDVAEKRLIKKADNQIYLPGFGPTHSEQVEMDYKKIEAGSASFYKANVIKKITPTGGLHSAYSLVDKQIFNYFDASEGTKAGRLKSIDKALCTRARGDTQDSCHLRSIQNAVSYDYFDNGMLKNKTTSGRLGKSVNVEEALKNEFTYNSNGTLATDTFTDISSGKHLVTTNTYDMTNSGKLTPLESVSTGPNKSFFSNYDYLTGNYSVFKKATDSSQNSVDNSTEMSSLEYNDYGQLTKISSAADQSFTTIDAQACGLGVNECRDGEYYYIKKGVETGIAVANIVFYNQNNLPVRTWRDNLGTDIFGSYTAYDSFGRIKEVSVEIKDQLLSRYLDTPRHRKRTSRINNDIKKTTYFYNEFGLVHYIHFADGSETRYTYGLVDVEGGGYVKNVQISKYNYRAPVTNENDPVLMTYSETIYSPMGILSENWYDSHGDLITLESSSNELLIGGNENEYASKLTKTIKTDNAVFANADTMSHITAMDDFNLVIEEYSQLNGAKINIKESTYFGPTTLKRVTETNSFDATARSIIHLDFEYDEYSRLKKETISEKTSSPVSLINNYTKKYSYDDCESTLSETNYSRGLLCEIKTLDSTRGGGLVPGFALGLPHLTEGGTTRNVQNGALTIMRDKYQRVTSLTETEKDSHGEIIHSATIGLANNDFGQPETLTYPAVNAAETPYKLSYKHERGILKGLDHGTDSILKKGDYGNYGNLDNYTLAGESMSVELTQNPDTLALGTKILTRESGNLIRKLDYIRKEGNVNQTIHSGLQPNSRNLRRDTWAFEEFLTLSDIGDVKQRQMDEFTNTKRIHKDLRFYSKYSKRTGESNKRRANRYRERLEPNIVDTVTLEYGTGGNILVVDDSSYKYGQDVDSKLLELNDISGEVNDQYVLEHNNRGQMISVASPDNEIGSIAKITYNGRGQPIQIMGGLDPEGGADVTTHITYSPSGELRSVYHPGNDSSYTKVTYLFGGLQQIIEKYEVNNGVDKMTAKQTRNYIHGESNRPVASQQVNYDGDGVTLSEGTNYYFYDRGSLATITDEDGEIIKQYVIGVFDTDLKQGDNLTGLPINITEYQEIIANAVALENLKGWFITNTGQVFNEGAKSINSTSSNTSSVANNNSSVANNNVMSQAIFNIAGPSLAGLSTYGVIKGAGYCSLGSTGIGLSLTVTLAAYTAAGCLLEEYKYEKLSNLFKGAAYTMSYTNNVIMSTNKDVLALDYAHIGTTTTNFVKYRLPMIGAKALSYTILARNDFNFNFNFDVNDMVMPALGLSFADVYLELLAHNLRDYIPVEDFGQKAAFAHTVIGFANGVAVGSSYVTSTPVNGDFLFYTGGPSPLQYVGIGGVGVYFAAYGSLYKLGLNDNRAGSAVSPTGVEQREFNPGRYYSGQAIPMCSAAFVFGVMAFTCGQIESAAN